MDKSAHFFPIKENLHFSLGECASSMIVMITSFCFLMYYSLEFSTQQALNHHMGKSLVHHLCQGNLG